MQEMHEGKTMMSPELEERFAFVSTEHPVPVCQLKHASGVLSGHVSRVVMSDTTFIVEMRMRDAVLQDILGCPKIERVCILLGDDRVYEKALESTWVQTRDVSTWAPNDVELSFYAELKDVSAGA